MIYQRSLKWILKHVGMYKIHYRCKAIMSDRLFLICFTNQSCEWSIEMKQGSRSINLVEMCTYSMFLEPLAYNFRFIYCLQDWLFGEDDVKLDDLYLMQIRLNIKQSYGCFRYRILSIRKAQHETEDRWIINI